MSHSLKYPLMFKYFRCLWAVLNPRNEDTLQTIHPSFAGIGPYGGLKKFSCRCSKNKELGHIKRNILKYGGWSLGAVQPTKKELYYVIIADSYLDQQTQNVIKKELMAFSYDIKVFHHNLIALKLANNTATNNNINNCIVNMFRSKRIRVEEVTKYEFNVKYQHESHQQHLMLLSDLQKLQELTTNYISSNKRRIMVILNKYDNNNYYKEYEKYEQDEEEEKSMLAPPGTYKHPTYKLMEQHREFQRTNIGSMTQKLRRNRKLNRTAPDGSNQSNINNFIGRNRNRFFRQNYNDNHRKHHNPMRMDCDHNNHNQQNKENTNRFNNNNYNKNEENKYIETPKDYSSQLRELENMGFCDSKRNLVELKKWSGDIQSVISQYFVFDNI